MLQKGFSKILIIVIVLVVIAGGVLVWQEWLVKNISITEAVLQYCKCDDHFRCGDVYECSNNVFKIIPVTTDVGVHYIDQDGKILAEFCGGNEARELPPECAQFYIEDFKCEQINLCKIEK